MFINVALAAASDLGYGYFFADVLPQVKLQSMHSLVQELVSLTQVGTAGTTARKQLWEVIRKVSQGEGIWRRFSATPKEICSEPGYFLFYFVKIYAYYFFTTYQNTKDGLFYSTPLNSATAWLKLIAEATLLLILNESTFEPLHDWMHNKMYWIHKTHHVPMKEVWWAHNYHFDFLDLFLEAAGAPFLYMGLQYALGFSPGIQFGSMFLVSQWAWAGHTINPYAKLVNPLFDGLGLRSNVSHQLHHALNKDRYTSLPIYQVRQTGALQEDIDVYNKVFGTSIVI